MKAAAQLVLLLLIFSGQLSGQNFYDFQHRMEFAEDLHSNGFYTSSIAECKLILALNPNILQKDSLLWLMSRNQLATVNEMPENALFLHFSPKSPQLKAWANQLLILGQLKSGSLKRQGLHFPPLDSVPTDLHPTLAWLRIASSLLDHDASGLDSLSLSAQKWPQSDIAYKSLRLAWQKFQTSKKKSPFKAGLLSAIVPGSGKIYSGNPVSGLLTLATSAGLGLQAWEGWRKSDKKWTNPQFLVYGTAFLGYYIANIYGSVIQAKKYNVGIETDLHHNIRLSVLIPVEHSLRKWR